MATPANLRVPSQARSLLLSKDTYQQLHTVDDCVYGVLSDCGARSARRPKIPGIFVFIMTEQLLVSGRLHALCAVDATRRALEDGQRIESVAALWRASSRMSPTPWTEFADRLARELDEIEEQVLSDGASDLRQGLGRRRRTCVRLHRQLSGLRVDVPGWNNRIPAISSRPCSSAPAGWHNVSTASITPSSRCLPRAQSVVAEELHLKIEQQGNNNIRALRS